MRLIRNMNNGRVMAYTDELAKLSHMQEVLAPAVKEPVVEVTPQVQATDGEPVLAVVTNAPETVADAEAATGEVSAGADVPKGIVNDPANEPAVAPAQEARSLKAMTKAEMEVYALETFGVDLDLRKTVKVLIAEIEALEAAAKGEQ